MMVGPVEGAFLRFFVAAARPRRVLEIGVFTGWSSIEMASALPPGGRLVACDVNEETTAVARRYAQEAGVAERIEYRLGPALETLAELEGPFDLVFLDARKDEYLAYYEAVLPKLAEGGTILADNTLFGMDEEHPLAEFNRRILADQRAECVLLPIREGVTLIRRRPPPTGARRSGSCSGATSRATRRCSRRRSTRASTTCGRGCPGRRTSRRRSLRRSSCCAGSARRSTAAGTSRTGSSRPTSRRCWAARGSIRASARAGWRSATGCARAQRAGGWRRRWRRL